MKTNKVLAHHYIDIDNSRIVDVMGIIYIMIHDLYCNHDDYYIIVSIDGEYYEPNESIIKYILNYLKEVNKNKCFAVCCELTENYFLKKSFIMDYLKKLKKEM